MDQLFKENAHFGWSLGTLKLWSKADFRCVYCDLNMFASLDNNQLGVLDHLLPQSRYPLLKVSPSNFTPKLLGVQSHKTALGCQHESCHTRISRRRCFGTCPTERIDYAGSSIH